MHFTSGWQGVCAAWLVFAGAHLLLSSRRVRPRLISMLGPQIFQAFYSVVALAGFVLLVNAYWGSVHSGPLLWDISAVPAVRCVSVVLSLVALTLALGSLFQPVPTAMGSTSIKRARGLTRITRHPLFVFLGIAALSHLLVNGYASDVIFFSGFAVFAVVGGAHLDSRKRVSDREALREFFAETSILPFVAIIQGRSRLVIGELPWLGLAVGAAASALLFIFHESLFG